MGQKENDQKASEVASTCFSPDRREFVKLAVGGALSAAGVFASPRTASATVHQVPRASSCARRLPPSRPTRICSFSSRSGAEYVSVGSTPDLRTAEGFLQIKKRYADAGITVWNIGNTNVHNMPEVTLNLPGRDQKIEEYKQYLRNLGKAGIYYTTYAHMGNGIWSSGRRHHSRRVRPGVRSGEPEQEGRLGRQDLEGAALARPRVHRRRRSGRTTPISSSRWRRSRKRTASASAFIPTIRRCRCWPACRAASSATSTATSAPWRSPTAPTSASACAAGPGSKAARAHGQGPGGDDPLLRRRRRSGRSTSATSARRCRTSWRPSWTTAITTCTRS